MGPMGLAAVARAVPPLVGTALCPGAPSAALGIEWAGHRSAPPATQRAKADASRAARSARGAAPA
eukprot:2573098-Pleurochrysis_carterae.AAC.1